MPVRKVLTLGDDLLRQKALVVNNFSDPLLSEIITDMIDTMREYKGVGLAAPQIGVSKRIIVIEIDNNPRYPEAQRIPLRVLINPEIINFSARNKLDWEGCLSLPGMRGKVNRAMQIDYQACDINGQLTKNQATGFLARVIQHEIDHLDGIVYPDRMDNLTEFGFEASLPAFRGVKSPGKFL